MRICSVLSNDIENGITALTLGFTTYQAHLAFDRVSTQIAAGLV